MPLGSAIAKFGSKAVEAAKGLRWDTMLFFILPALADAASRLNAQRGQLKAKLSEAKKRCKGLSEYEERQKCQRDVIIDWAKGMASSYDVEIRYLKQALAKADDIKKKEKIEKMLYRAEKQRDYYTKLANILSTSDVPITTAYEMARGTYKY